MPIEWMRTRDAFPELDRTEDDFTAFDGTQSVGRVYRIQHGPERGQWFWTMTAERPGVLVRGRSGTEARRGDAGRRVVETYELLLSRSAPGA